LGYFPAVPGETVVPERNVLELDERNKEGPHFQPMGGRSESYAPYLLGVLRVSIICHRFKNFRCYV
jgi:hypothetical protein